MRDMTHNWKKASVGTSLALAALALGAYAYTRAHAEAASTYHLANGMEVTVAEAPQDDIARVLDIHVWKLDVVTPDDHQICALTIDQCGHQKVLGGLGGGGFQPVNHHVHLTLDLAPLGGDLGRAQQVKYYLQSDAGGATSGYFPNPLRGLAGLANGTYVSERDNRVYLMGGGKQASSPAGMNDVDIALVIEPGSRVP